MRIGIISGGFDPIHSGHLAYLKAGKEACDWLVVGVNTDEWLTRKKGRSFMPYDERVSIIEQLESVDQVLWFNDDDNSAFDLIRQAFSQWGSTHEIIFMNGGDRTKENIPEEILAEKYNIPVTFEFGIGGADKKNSSSWILEEWRAPKTQRDWGWYRVLDEQKSWAVKELTIEPYHSLSDQRHFHRSENWNITSGEVHIDLEYENGRMETRVFGAGETFQIPKKTWHRVYNNMNEPAKVIEVWLGSQLSEEDIERRS